MIDHKKDKFVVKKIVPKKDYFQKDKMVSCLYTEMHPKEDENKHRKMRSRGFF